MAYKILDRMGRMLGKGSTAPVEQPSPNPHQGQEVVINNIHIAQLYRFNKSLADYKTAVTAAESVRFPRRKQLYELYHDFEGTPAWRSAWSKRSRYVRNKPLVYRDKDGNVDETMTELTHTLWFDDLIRYMLEPVAYGHSLIEPMLKEGVIHGMDIIPRHMVSPERGLVYVQELDEQSAIRYRDHGDMLLEVGKPRDLGLMVDAMPYCIMNRQTWGHWGQFEEMFGMPIRIYKYNAHDPTSRTKAETAAKNMGSAAYIVIPESMDVELVKGADAASTENYDRKRLATNEELAILVLGNTMTTKNGSSRSQAEIHKEEQMEVHYEDIERIQFLLNYTAKGFMAKYGLPIREGFSFEYEQSVKLTPAQKIELIKSLIDKGLEIPASYMYREFGIPAPKEGEPYLGDIRLSKQLVSGQHIDDATDEDGDDDPMPKDEDMDDPDVSALVQHLNTIYGLTPPLKGDSGKVARMSVPAKIKAAIPSTGYASLEDILEGIWAGTIQRGDIDADLFEHYQSTIWEGWQGSYGADYDELPLGSAEREAMEGMWDYSHRFAAHKAYRELGEYVDMRSGFESLEEFVKAAKARHKDFGVNFLRAEVHTAEQCAITRREWEGFQTAKASRPNLRYETVGDKLVRDDHKALDGFTAPVDAPIWDRIAPPNGYGCRCDLIQTSAKITVGAPPEIAVRDEFNFNPAKVAKLFASHPYFDVPDSAQTDSDRNFGFETPEL